MIALDDFTENDPRHTLTDFADILKVDVRNTTPEQRAAMVKRYGPWKCRMLARKSKLAKNFSLPRRPDFFTTRATSSAARNHEGP